MHFILLIKFSVTLLLTLECLEFHATLFSIVNFFHSCLRQLNLTFLQGFSPFFPQYQHIIVLGKKFKGGDCRHGTYQSLNVLSYLTLYTQFTPFMQDISLA